MDGISMTTIWTALLIIFFVAEMLTAGALVSIWFCAGSGAALICAYLNGPLWLQIFLFIVISVLMLLITRPLCKKIQPVKQHTNADMILGEIGQVHEPIDNLKGTGTVLIAGKLWSARQMDGNEILEKGTEVIIDHIEGVKAVVRKKV